MGPLPAPAPKRLWEATDEASWRRLYTRWRRQWAEDDGDGDGGGGSGGIFKMSEFIYCEPGVKLHRRAELWFGEADEFGMLLMAESKAEFFSLLRMMLTFFSQWYTSLGCEEGCLKPCIVLALAISPLPIPSPVVTEVCYFDIVALRVKHVRRIVGLPADLLSDARWTILFSTGGACDVCQGRDSELRWSRMTYMASS
jgi:hypothetical protein